MLLSTSSSLLLIASTVLSNPIALEKRGSGRISYYGPAAGEAGPFGNGACENYPQDEEYFVAVGASVYDSSMCGQCIEVTYNGRSSVGPMADKCPSCGGGLDVSLAMFGELVGSVDKAVDVGILNNVEWRFVGCPSGKGVSGGKNGGSSARDLPEPKEEESNSEESEKETPKNNSEEPATEGSVEEKPKKETRVEKQPKTDTRVEEEEEEEKPVRGSAPVIVGSAPTDNKNKSKKPSSTTRSKKNPNQNTENERSSSNDNKQDRNRKKNESKSQNEKDNNGHFRNGYAQDQSILVKESEGDSKVKPTPCVEQ